MLKRKTGEKAKLKFWNFEGKRKKRKSRARALTVLSHSEWRLGGRWHLAASLSINRAVLGDYFSTYINLHVYPVVILYLDA